MNPRTAQCAYVHALDELIRLAETEKNAVIAGHALTTRLPMLLAEVALQRYRIGEGEK